MAKVKETKDLTHEELLKRYEKLEKEKTALWLERNTLANDNYKMRDLLEMLSPFQNILSRLDSLEDKMNNLKIKIE